MKDMCFMNPRYGKCQIIAYFGGIAIVKLEKNFEKYVVAVGLTQLGNSWRAGYYYREFDDAVKTFNTIIQDFYEVKLEI